MGSPVWCLFIYFIDHVLVMWIGFCSGPFYVMMAPQDVLQSTGLGQRTLVPRSGIVPKLEPGSRITRDDRRRATHNEGLYD